MRAARTVTALAVTAPFALGLSVAAQAADEPGPWFRFQDPAIVESSGVALVDGLVVTVNDSGDDARLFVVDPSTGETVGVTRWDGAAVDIESLAPAGGDAVWVGDIGDNGKERASVTVTRVSVGRGERTVEGESFELAYPEGSADAEALLADPVSGRLVVVTKSPFGGRFYLAPEELDPDGINGLTPVRRSMVLVTGGEFFPDGRHLVIRNYGRAEIYTWPELGKVGTVDLPKQEQGEAIAVTPDGTLVITSEGDRAPVLQVALPRAVERRLAPSGPDPSPSESEGTPTTGSREGQELPEDDPGRRDPRQWLIGTGLLAAAFLVLWRALRPR